MKSNRKLYRYGVLASVSLGVFLMAAAASAKVEGQCAVCHTMHNSQDGTPMAVDAAGAPQTAPNEVLLVKGCVACHTGTNQQRVAGTFTIPFVNSTTTPTYGADGTTGDTLAGGNFYWVATTGGGVDSTGHNVATDGLSGQDATLGTTPPGYTGGATLPQLTCAGTNGCHGDKAIDSDFGAISGSHHADDSAIDGTTVAKSYRFLDGIIGIEDWDWEYTPTSTEHNQYKGVARTTENDEDPQSISSLCAQCHDSFHNGAGEVGGTNPTTGVFASPWVRHPTDFDMGNIADTTTEYYSYGGANNDYQVTAPVASSDLSLGVVSQVTFNNDTIVTCIACHRAHGTPNDDLLRWDYSVVNAGVSGTGACFTCHTTK